MKDPAAIFNERFTKAETPEALYEAIASTSTLRVIEGLAWRVDEQAREAAVRIRERYNAKYKSLHLPFVPMNIPDIIRWCEDATRIIRERDQQNGRGQASEPSAGEQTTVQLQSPPVSCQRDEMEVGQVKEYAERVAELLEPMDIPPLEPTWESEPPGLDHTNRVAQRIAAERDKVLRPLKVEYRKAVVAILDDSWEPVADIFEHYAPQTLGRLDGWRREILDHTDPAKDSIYWLECRDREFGPNIHLRKLIGKLESKLHREAEHAETALNRVKLDMEKPEPRPNGQEQTGGTTPADQKRETIVQKAHRIHRLVQNDRVWERFREQGRAFYDRLKAWQQVNDAYEAAIESPNWKLHEITASERKCAARMEALQKKGLQTSAEYEELEKTRIRLADEKRVASDELEKAKASIQEPGACPVDWLGLPGGGLSRHDRALVEYCFPDSVPVVTKESERLRAYVLTTILHDETLKGTCALVSEGIWPLNTDFVQTQWNKMEADWALWHDEIDAAIDFVKADLAKPEPRPEGLGQPLDIPGLIEKLKALRSALDSRDEESISRARSDLKAYVGSAEQLYDALQKPLRGSTVDAIERLKWVGDARKSRMNTGLYPAVLDALATPEFIAELERWQEQTSEAPARVAGKPDDKEEKAPANRSPTDKDMVDSQETLVDLYTALSVFLEGQETGKQDLMYRAMRGASNDPVHHFRKRAIAIRDRLASLGFVSVPDIPDDVEHIFVWCHTVITGLRATSENPPEPTSEATSRPMPLTDIADRLLKDPKKWRKVKTLLGDRLTKLADKNWVVKLDGLPPNWRKELERR